MTNFGDGVSVTYRTCLGAYVKFGKVCEGTLLDAKVGRGVSVVFSCASCITYIVEAIFSVDRAVGHTHLPNGLGKVVIWTGLYAFHGRSIAEVVGRGTVCEACAVGQVAVVCCGTV